jgi:hypothetical protein
VPSGTCSQSPQVLLHSPWDTLLKGSHWGKQKYSAASQPQLQAGSTGGAWEPATTQLASQL